MKITYYGHSCLLVEGNGKRVIIDPFLSGNPGSGVSPESVNVDAVILTHGHDDHFGDTLQIAKANRCPVIAVFELAVFCQSKGVEAHAMNIGGKYHFDGFTVKYTQAFHGSSVRDGDQLLYAGQPAGVLLTMGDKTLYDAGDTCLFGDMKLIGQLNRIDIAAIPIGDNFTMGPEEASIAAEWIGAKQVIPLHYNTFPVIEQNPNDFGAMLSRKNITAHILNSKDSIEV